MVGVGWKGDADMSKSLHVQFVLFVSGSPWNVARCNKQLFLFVHCNYWKLNRVARPSKPMCFVLIIVFWWGPTSWSSHQVSGAFFSLHLSNKFHTAAVLPLSGDKGSSCYDENNSAAWVSCFCLTPGSVTLLKTQTALSPHGDILMAANHTSISSYVSPSNKLRDGKGWGMHGYGSLLAFVRVRENGTDWVDFSFLSPSPLTVTTDRFIFLFIHLGYIEPRRAGQHK